MEHMEYSQPPGFYRGLNMAESAQLSMDYQASPEAFEAVRLFCGKYVDERASLGEELSKHLEMVDHLNRNQLAYYEVFDEVGLRRQTNMFREKNIKAEPERVIMRAHGAAGAYILDLKQQARESLAGFLANADGLSVLLAEFCQDRLERGQLIIMGKRFDYSMGFLACTEKEHPMSLSFRHYVYGSHSRFIALRRSLEPHHTAKEMKDLHYGHANARDW